MRELEPAPLSAPERPGNAPGRGVPTLWARLSAPLLIALLVALAFSPVLGAEFVNWDDDANFLENSGYRGLSPAHLRWMFTTFHMGNYQPLTWLSLGIDYQLWGMDARGYHLTNLLLHVASTILFYLFLRRFLELLWRDKDAGSPRWPAAMGALLFAIHPLRVESVAWATERKDVLSGLFFMLTLLAYLKLVHQEREGRPTAPGLALAAGFYACSLLSKALGLMLPVALLVMDVYPLGRFVPGKRVKVLLEKLPFALLALAEGLLTYQAIGAAGLVRSAGSLEIGSRAEEAAYGLCFYLWKTLLPFHLSPLYPVPRPFDPGATFLWASVLGVIAITAALVALRRRAPGGLAAWTAYAALLLPVLGILNEAPHLAADRYAYLACLPGSILVAAILDRCRRGRGPGENPVPLLREPLAVLSAAGVLGLGLLTHAQAGVWTDSLALWNQAIRVDPANWTAHNNRGIARAAGGDPKGAISDFTEAIRLYPEFVDALYNRGRVRTEEGDLVGAMADLSEAIRLEPRYARAYRGRGLARQAKGDTQGAESDFTQATKIEAALPAPSGLLGPANSPKAPEAVAQVEKMNNEGNALAGKGDFAGAISKYTQAIQLDPGISGIYNNRANARAARGDQAGAVLDYTQAIQLNPRFAEAFANRGMSRALLGDLRGAEEDYTEALAISPQDPEVHANRGIVRAKQGALAGAVEDFETALATAPPGWPKAPTVRSLLARVKRR